MLTFKYEIHEKKSFISSFFESQSGFPYFAVVLLSLASVLPPIVALSINDALSTNSFVTSSSDFVWVAFDKSVIYRAGWFSCIAFIILLHYSFNLIHVKAIDLSLYSLINGSSSSPLGHPFG